MDDDVLENALVRARQDAMDPAVDDTPTLPPDDEAIQQIISGFVHKARSASIPTMPFYTFHRGKVFDVLKEKTLFGGTKERKMPRSGIVWVQTDQRGWAVPLHDEEIILYSRIEGGLAERNVEYFGTRSLAVSVDGVAMLGVSERGDVRVSVGMTEGHTHSYGHGTDLISSSVNDIGPLWAPGRGDVRNRLNYGPASLRTMDRRLVSAADLEFGTDRYHQAARLDCEERSAAWNAVPQWLAKHCARYLVEAGA